MADPTIPPLPPRIEVMLVPAEKSIPPSLLVRVAQATAPVLALSGAIGVLLLSFGWSYAWHWFAHWQVPFASLGLGPDLLLEYGRLVVVHFWWLALLWLLAIATAAGGLHRINAGTAHFACLIVVAFLIPWLSSHYLGAKRAEASVAELRAANFGGWPEVHVILNSEQAAVLPGSLLGELSIGPNLCYRLVLRASDGLWLVRIGGNGQPGPAAFLPNDAIVYLRLRAPSGGDC